VERTEQRAAALVQRLIQSPKGLPAFFHGAPDKQQEELDDAKKKVAFLDRQIDEIQASLLEAAAYQEALREFKQVFAALNPHHQSRLIAYLIERIELDHEAQVRMWMLGQNPERQNVNRLSHRCALVCPDPATVL
jgi:hypothetical protein